MPDNNYLLKRHRLNDSEICLRVAQFLQDTEAHPQSNGIALAVVGTDGELIAFGAHARCPPLPRQLAQRKAWSALRFRRATARLESEVEAGTLRLDAFHDPQLLAMPGGAPVLVEGIAIAGVGVSGLSPAADVEIVERFIATLF